MTFSDRDEAEIEASRAPLMDHLIELRRRQLDQALAEVHRLAVAYPEQVVAIGISD